jgi:hypothetical protein
MSFSEHRRAFSRSRKTLAFLSETGKAGTEWLYTDCRRKIQTEADAEFFARDTLLVLSDFRALKYASQLWNHPNY